MNYRTMAFMVADMAIFFEGTDEVSMDLDTSIKGLDTMMYHLNKMDREARGKLSQAITHIASEYDGEARAFVRTLPEALGLADEPDDGQDADD